MPHQVQSLTKRGLYVILGALMMGMFLSALDSTIVSTALPKITEDLNGGDHLAWAVVAYLLASTVSTPMWGKLGDLYGRKSFFQGAIVLFLAGSALSGLAHSFNEFVMFRAAQGLGGGGLMVGAQAIVGDIIPPRDRGRYAGFFGATFGAATVLGPLIGGLFVDSIGWRWCFYVNIPIGIAALAVTAAVLPSSAARIKHKIDYAGFVVLTLSASLLVIYTSLGGTSFAWFSTEGLAYLLTGVVLVGVFVAIELRASEPIIAPRLVRNRVFASASLIGFVVGFAMFGAMTFLPLYMQDVRGVSPTMSGLRILPMMAGLLTMSILSGRLVSQGWKYRPFPVIGTAVMTVGLAMLATITSTSSSTLMALYMFVLGLGIGSVMQILVTAVQNAVEPADLGAATAGANFFRSIGGSFGTAIFGALFANVLPGHLRSELHGMTVHVNLGLLSGADFLKVLHTLPLSAQRAVETALSESIQSVFFWAVPVAVLAFAFSLSLPEVKLKVSHPIDTLEPIPDTLG